MKGSSSSRVSTLAGKWRTITPLDELFTHTPYLIDKISLNSGSSGSSLTVNLPKPEAIVNPLPATKIEKRPTHLQFGYRKTPSGVAIHNGEQQVIQIILSYRASGLSYKKIAAHLTSMKVLHKIGKNKVASDDDQKNHWFQGTEN